MATLLSELFEGQVKKLLYACVLTCPWFSRAQAEVSAQARCNLLYVVFVSRDEQFFSLAAPHERELCGRIKEGEFLVATEIGLFLSLLHSGNVNAIEAYCSPKESSVLSTAEWNELSSFIDPASSLNRTFVDRCLGQAHGGIVKKMKKSKNRKNPLVMQDDLTMQKLCETFKLLEYTGNAVRRESISPWTQEESWKDQDASEEKEAMLALRKGFEGVLDRQLLFQLYCSLSKKLEHRVREVPPRGENWPIVETQQWLTNVRMDKAKLIPPSDPPVDVQGSEISSMLSEAGVPSILPTNVLAIAKAGSHMYNLALPSSDIDYIIIYRKPTEKVLASFYRRKEHMGNSSGGHAYEARMFCEMLRKGAVNIVEILFAGEWAYSSEAWKSLVSHKELLMSETIIQQYIGFLNTNMSMIAKGKYSGTSREGKTFYQIFHKLDSLASFVDGGYPLVQCRGEQRDFIMRIRNGPLEGELSPERLYSLAEERLGGLRDKLSWRERRWREVGDYRFLQTWLLSVRGVSLEEPLKMAKQPIGI